MRWGSLRCGLVSMENTKTLETLNAIRTTELHYIEELLAAISRARRANDWLEADVFAEILAVGMRLADAVASDLAKDEGISRSAISKWLKQSAVPSVPTRKTVVLWLQEKLHARERVLKDELSITGASNHMEANQEVA